MRVEEMSKEQLLEIVKRLPLTADGVPIVPGMRIWNTAGWDWTLELCENNGHDVWSRPNLKKYPVYSSREAAIAISQPAPPAANSKEQAHD